MGIGADNDITGSGVRLGYYLVAYAAAGLIKDAAGLAGKVPEKNMVIGKLLVGAGSRVVNEQQGSLRIGQTLEAA